MNQMTLRDQPLSTLLLYLCLAIITGTPLFSLENSELTKDKSPIRSSVISNGPLTAKMQEIGFQFPTRVIQAPNFELLDLSGDSRSLDSFRGSLVLVHFWATWCTPCLVEMPTLQKLYQRLYEDIDIAIVAINIKEDESLISKFLKKMSLSFPVLLDNDGNVSIDYGARTIPISFLIDENGALVARLVGAANWTQPQFEFIFRTLSDLRLSPS